MTVLDDLVRTDTGAALFLTTMTTSPDPARLRAALLTPERLRSISAHLDTVPDFKEEIINVVLPHDHKSIIDMSTTLARTALKPRRMDVSPLRAEMTTFIHEALRVFERNSRRNPQMTKSYNNFFARTPLRKNIRGHHGTKPVFTKKIDRNGLWNSLRDRVYGNNDLLGMYVASLHEHI